MPRIRVIGSVIAVAALVVSVNAGQTANTGVIVGRVIDAASKQPIGGARVSLTLHEVVRATRGVEAPAPVAPANRPLPFIVVNGVPTGTRGQTPPTEATPLRSAVRCDENGQFVFYELPATAFDVIAEAPGYYSPQPNGRPVTLAAGQRVFDVEVALTRTSEISGRVVDEFGDPMVGITVGLSIRPSQPAAGRGAQSSREVVTDDRGYYRALNLVPGDYIAVISSTYVTAPGTVNDQVLEELSILGGNTTGAPAFSTNGAISASGSFRVGGAELQPWNQLARYSPPVRPDGKLMVYPTMFYPSGLTSQQALPIHVDAGETRDGVDIHMMLVPAVRVMGRTVSPDGSGVRSTVTLSAVDPTTDRVVGNVTSTVSDAQGRFVILGVSPGEYSVSATAVMRQLTLERTTTTQRVGVGAQDLSGLVLIVSGGHQ